MRNTFIRTLTELAVQDPDIEVLTGDLGFGIWEDFIRQCPGRFTNMGIAEQNMTGMAAGMAMAGKTVFVYSIGVFPTLRCLEQIRNDCAYHAVNVKIVSAGSGLSYGALGMSHHMTEDMAVLRAIPGIRIYCPADQTETEAAVREMVRESGCCYLRLGRDGQRLHEQIPERLSGNILPVGESREEETDVAFLAIGDILSEAVKASEILREDGISSRVFSVPVLKPFSGESLRRIAGRTGLIVTVEEHNMAGGLGSAAAETLAEHPNGCGLLRIGLDDRFAEAVGSREYLRKTYGLDAASVAEAVRGRWKAGRAGEDR